MSRASGIGVGGIELQARQGDGALEAATSTVAEIFQKPELFMEVVRQVEQDKSRCNKYFTQHAMHSKRSALSGAGDVVEAVEKAGDQALTARYIRTLLSTGASGL